MTLTAFRKARSDRKRESILAAGLDLFRRLGFSETSMEQVAKTAQVSTATLYRHFRSKEALFEAVAMNGLERIAADERSKAEGPVKRLTALARAYSLFLCEPETRGLMRMLIGETNRNPALSDRFYGSIKAKLSDIFAAAVQAGMEEGVVRKHDNPAFVAGQLQGMIEHGTLMLGLIRGDDVPPGFPAEKIAREAMKTWAARWVIKDKA